MNYRFLTAPLLGLLLLAGGQRPLNAESFSAPWFVVANGGGTSSAGLFSLTGTFGQWDANEQPLTNDLFALTGGFWSFLAAPQEGGTNIPVIVLSGDLAFGGVALNATSNLTFVISNAGNFALTVSNISYPVGFTGSWASGTIGAGLTQSVTVTFSPSSATNYTGLVAIYSDATNGNGDIPISGFGASESYNIIVDINGDGAVTPNLNGKLLSAGRSYTLRAVPGSGQVFSNWTGSINTNKNPLTFTMNESMLLQANFVPNPFLSIKGTYNGLFYATNGVTEETAGMLKGLTVGGNGAYSGILLINGARHPISGAFDLNREASNHISRPAGRGGALTLTMVIDPCNFPPQISGAISGTNDQIPWMANLVANLSTNGGSGEYTMLLSPPESSVPPGYGYSLITRHNGVLVFNGALADGAPVHQTVPVSQTGDVPVFANLYGNTGLLLGWINLTDGVIAGNLEWIKPAAPRSLRYPQGFTNLITTQGATWTNPSPASAIGLTNVQLNISGGSLVSPLIFDVVPGADNQPLKSTDTPTNSLSVFINPRNGLLTVTFGTGEGRATTTGRCAMLQSTTNAAGFFLDRTNVGSIILQP